MNTIWTNQRISIAVNSSGELFVTELNSSVQIRISDSRVGLVITAQGSNMSPTSVNGLDAFRVTRKG